LSFEQGAPIMRALPFSYGLPRDVVSLAALVAGGAWLVLARAPRLSRRVFVLVASIAAAFLSWGYVQVYLRGGPRIIDATAYTLEARALAHGLLAWELPEPRSEVVGRFLVESTLDDAPRRIGVIFPPGYPAVLAIGEWLGAPMWVGPGLAAGTTLLVAKLVDQLLPSELAERERWLRACVVTSVVCGALRYHTADTMSHGLAALLFTAVLVAAISHRSEARHGTAALLGASLGLLFATRPVTAAACAILAALVLAPSRAPVAREGLSRLSVGTLAALPPVVLFFAHQRAVTGGLFVSSQRHYYATTDGPPDCFRWGFGQNVGCLQEHGAFVRHNLPDGFTFVPVIKTTGRRLAAFLQDPLNDEILGVLLIVAVLFALVTHGRSRRDLLATALAVPSLVLAYAPFYFDGNYPGGGARFFADGLPCFLVAGFVGLARASAQAPTAARFAFALPGLALLGFSLNAHTDHELLRDREGGRPMWLASDVASLPRDAVLFVDTDHAFNLALDPTRPHTIVRYRADLADTFVPLDGRPAFLHRYDVASGTVDVSPHVPDRTASVLCASSLWPPTAQVGAFVLPLDGPGPCRADLEVHSVAPASAVTLSAPDALAGRTLSVDADGAVVVELGSTSPPSLVARWGACEGLGGPCLAFGSPVDVPVGSDGLVLILRPTPEGPAEVPEPPDFPRIRQLTLVNSP
jgi:hypothetical protein